MARLHPGRWLRPYFRQSAALQQAMAGVEAGLVGAVMGATSHLSVERASDFGCWLGRRLAPRMRKDRNVRGNLAVAFPDRDLDWIAATAIEIWGQIGRSLAEFAHLPRITGLELHHRFELVNHVSPAELTGARTGFVFAAPHQANWNLHAVAGALGGFPFSVVYAQQKNRALERLIARYRDRIPCDFIPVARTVRWMMAELNAGRHVGLFVDHRIDEGEMVPFFGHPASTTTIAARIAAKLDSAVIPTRLERLPGVRFRLTLEEPIRPLAGLRDPREAAFDMATRLNARFEAWIRERPADWCCVKRRWPKEVTEFARLDAGLIATVGDLHRSPAEPASSRLPNRTSSVHLEG